MTDSTFRPGGSDPGAKYREFMGLVEEGVKPPVDLAVEAFWQRFVNKARWGGKRRYAEDLAAKATERVYRHYHKLDVDKGPGSAIRWFNTIIENLIRNKKRDESRNPIYPSGWFSLDYEEDSRSEWDGLTSSEEGMRFSPERLTDRSELRRIVDEAIEELKPHHREVFILKERKGLTYKEIAERTDLKLGTVKSRLSRARRSLREYISQTPVGQDYLRDMNLEEAA